MGANSLLRFPELAGAERYCLNLVDMASDGEITAVTGNANDMRGVFEDDRFDLVLCSATLEHDKRFWLTVGEMKRVLKPGGLLIISVPGYVKDPERDHGPRDPHLPCPLSLRLLPLQRAGGARGVLRAACAG